MIVGFSCVGVWYFATPEINPGMLVKAKMLYNSEIGKKNILNSNFYRRL